MGEWILILTFFPGIRDAGVAINHVPGFHTKSICQAAADAWEKRWAGYRVDAKAVCVLRN